MESIQSLLDQISLTVKSVAETAREVNSASHERKEFSMKSLRLLAEIGEGNDAIQTNFEKVMQTLNDSREGIIRNSDDFKANLQYYTEVIDTMKNIKVSLDMLEKAITGMTAIVEDIKSDTDEIFTLALNASIVSSKYSHTSGVFDIIANKLNEMSNFININLESIVRVVQPITDGISRLADESGLVLADIEKGYNSFVEFSTIIDAQKESINELWNHASDSGLKIGDRKRMIEEINQKVSQMDADADGSINGSAKNITLGDELHATTGDAVAKQGDSEALHEVVSLILEKGTNIWQSALQVNEKSRSQLEFSQSSLEFCNSIIDRAAELRSVIEVFNQQSLENNKVAGNISENLSRLTEQLDVIEKKMMESNSNIHAFNEDYRQIDNILEFLKDILKSMNIIGMYSRIESARDPMEFSGFMTISENIIKLQHEIQNSIPLIEENITKTHGLIENINSGFERVSTQFFTILNSSGNIISKLKEITELSSESGIFSAATLENSEVLDGKLQQVKNHLSDLLEIVQKPIEGSALNIERGRTIEHLCREILERK